MSITHIAFYPSDWLAGTRTLSDAETGVYITLICHMYDMAGPIERNDDRLWRMCGCKSKVGFLKSLDYLIAEGKITEVEDGLFNDKVEKELKIVVAKSSKAQEAAQQRWNKKSNKIKKRSNASASLEHMPQPCQPEPEPEPDKEKKDDADLAKAKPAAKRGTRLSPDWFLPRAWGEWALQEGATPDQIRFEAAQFKDYWVGKTKDATKLDWLATWRGWIRRAMKRNGERTNGKSANSNPERVQRVIGAAAEGTSGKDWG